MILKASGCTIWRFLHEESSLEFGECFLMPNTTNLVTGAAGLPLLIMSLVSPLDALFVGPFIWWHFMDIDVLVMESFFSFQKDSRLTFGVLSNVFPQLFHLALHPNALQLSVNVWVADSYAWDFFVIILRSWRQLNGVIFVISWLHSRFVNLF